MDGRDGLRSRAARNGGRGLKEWEARRPVLRYSRRPPERLCVAYWPPKGTPRQSVAAVTPRTLRCDEQARPAPAVSRARRFVCASAQPAKTASQSSPSRLSPLASRSNRALRFDSQITTRRRTAEGAAAAAAGGGTGAGEAAAVSPLPVIRRPRGAGQPPLVTLQQSIQRRRPGSTGHR